MLFSEKISQENLNAEIDFELGKRGLRLVEAVETARSAERIFQNLTEFENERLGIYLQGLETAEERIKVIDALEKIRSARQEQALQKVIALVTPFLDAIPEIAKGVNTLAKSFARQAEMRAEQKERDLKEFFEKKNEKTNEEEE